MYVVNCGKTETPHDIDLPGLRAKYRQEADKRRRPERLKQYLATANDLAEYYETDPSSPPVPRDPISDEVDVAVLGGGFAGLLVAARLKEAGVTSLRVIDMGGDFGGTWYWNRYPGVQCDVKSYTYLPLLEEVNYVPKDRYSYGPEIYEHCQRIGKHFGLYEHALFGTIVRTMRWDESIKRWRISTDRGDDIRARFVAMGPGPMNKPKLPGIPGIKSFKGHTFHTARWDYDYTGGDTSGGLVKLADKRVAIIGTGATAIQCVPFLGRYAKHLYVLQRTPSYVDERGNVPTDPAWAKSLKPGWQAERQHNFTVGAAIGGSFSPDHVDTICDGWTEINRNMQAKLAAMGNPTLTSKELDDMREMEDYRAMERIRQRTANIVKDPQTAETLKAWYRWTCKRPCFNDDYLPTFNRPNVTLIDVSGTKGVERITEKGIVANGVEFEIDCLIYASGFEITADLKRRFGIDAIEGRGGLSLYENWGNGYKTLHGMTTHGFPNYFYTGYSQGAIAGSITQGYDLQARHIAYMIKETLARGAKTVEASQEAQDAWVKTIRDNFVFDADFYNACTPSYFNHEGEIVSTYTIHGEPYGKGFDAFDELLKEWRAKGDLAGLVLGA